jgi:hypothetical protein
MYHHHHHPGHHSVLPSNLEHDSLLPYGRYVVRTGLFGAPTTTAIRNAHSELILSYSSIAPR